MHSEGRWESQGVEKSFFMFDAESSAFRLTVGVASNLKDRVLGEVEQKGFIALPGRRSAGC